MRLICRFKPIFLGLVETHMDESKISKCGRIFGKHWNFGINPASGISDNILSLEELLRTRRHQMEIKLSRSLYCND